jgi:general secretion pathway protein G
MQIRTPGTRPSAGFTLVEVLIVVVILGILAAIVVPQFTSAAEATREGSTQMDLNRIRTQIEIYRAQHNDTPPSLAAFEDQMTQASDKLGNTAAPGSAGYDLGPYIRSVPINKFTGANTVSNGSVGSSDWYYEESTGDFRANHDATARDEW